MPSHKLRVADNVAVCIAKIIASETGGEELLDRTIAPGVTITKLPPSVTGFPAWRRQEEYIQNPEVDLHRGHADWVVPESADNRTPRILYCHGGGYEYYSPQDVYRPATSRLAAAASMPLLAFDYRLAPEFRHPAQLEDALQALRWIAANGPYGPGEATAIFLAGDSAGGGLALALALHVRDEPIEGAEIAGISVVSPETDLSCSGESYTTRRWSEGCGSVCDPVFRDKDPAAASMPTIYRLLGEPGKPGSYSPTHPSISPIHADLHGLPPTHIHVGDAEVMLSDAVDFAKKANAAGSPVEATVWPRMWHTFTQFSEGCGGDDAQPLDEALQALKQQGDFFRDLAAMATARRKHSSLIWHGFFAEGWPLGALALLLFATPCCCLVWRRRLWLMGGPAGRSWCSMRRRQKRGSPSSSTRGAEGAAELADRNFKGVA